MQNFTAIYVPGSLFDKNELKWNLSALNNPLCDLRREKLLKLDGINSLFLYVGSAGSSFGLHEEDLYLPSISYLHEGGPKVCVLTKHGIKVRHVEQQVGQYIVTIPNSFYYGFNMADNLAEATNFSSKSWLLNPKILKFKPCACTDENVGWHSIGVPLQYVGKECEMNGDERAFGPTIIYMIDFLHDKPHVFICPTHDSFPFIIQVIDKIKTEVDEKSPNRDFFGNLINCVLDDLIPQIED
ncbi:unnamed protein product [Didymodactylos carnosus]|uniref:JmjC domain-containing protein n=1 Tax=Didymodactylos carnosus TaxID=1234261 RepID=A0A814J946_9BILA|nr:unnamed protein product [Didymodactylos carnosus]CAF1106738.1 unnamed protein product [Didymodactylos carnosus]CAF3804943.1 unnamed protein product [Didymodactylos carnosus]CAF3870777.1 unnamed protein product [Didymodactylos carnosus]